ncbi:hypothetical protein L195_g063106, partial [Trifolium pratense]
MASVTNQQISEHVAENDIHTPYHPLDGYLASIT